MTEQHLCEVRPTTQGGPLLSAVCSCGWTGELRSGRGSDLELEHGRHRLEARTERHRG